MKHTPLFTGLMLCIGLLLAVGWLPRMDHGSTVEAQAVQTYVSMGLKRVGAGATNVPTADFPPGRVAFSSYRDDNLNIFVVNTDGSELTHLTTNTRSDHRPRLSPAGDRVVFQSLRNGNWDVCVVDVAGIPETNLRCLTTSSLADDIEPAWSPDGSQIAFVSNREPDGWYRIYVMNADGSNVRAIATGGAPAWAPDGNRLVYRDWDEEVRNTNIYTINLDGSGRTELTNTTAEDRFPVWSPDGSRIAFESNRTGSGDIFVINPDGTGLVQLTSDPQRDSNPSWSPDSQSVIFDSKRGLNNDLYVIGLAGESTTQPFTPGNALTDEYEPDWRSARPAIDATATPLPSVTRTPPAGTATPIVPVDNLTGCIAFASSRNGHHDIFVASANGTGPILQITNDAATDMEPRLTNDCRKVVFQSNRSGDYEVYSADVAATPEQGLRRLTNSIGFDGEPAWSPDGSQIAFTSHRPDYYAIYLMNADGSNQRLLTSGSRSDWSPDGRTILHRDWVSDNNDIFVIAADAASSAARTLIAGNVASEDTPKWSPDGTQIAFVSNRTGNFEVYVMNADGSNVIQRTFSIDRNLNVTWSPDGTRLLFASVRDTPADLFVVNVTGERNEISLLALNGTTTEEINPDWVPGNLPITEATATPTVTTAPTDVPPTATAGVGTPSPTAETNPLNGLFTPEQIAVEPDTNFEIRLNNPTISGAAGVRLVVEYDPAFITCDDRAAGNPTIPPQPFTFSILPNGCNNGRYEFVGAIQGTTDNIQRGSVARVIFRSTGNLGQTALRLVEAEYLDRNGQLLARLQPNAALPVTITADSIQGVVTCQAGTSRRANLFASTDEGTGAATSFTTVASGAAYTLAAPRGGNPYSVIATCPCHLAARQLDINAPATGQNVRLLGGDIDDNDQINILDVITIGRLFNRAPGEAACADLNQNGVVDLPDLTITQANFRRSRFQPFDPRQALSDPAQQATVIALPAQTPATVSCRMEPANNGEATLILEVTNVSDLYGYSVELQSSPQLTLGESQWTLGQFVQSDIVVENSAQNGRYVLTISQQGELAGASGSGELGRIKVRAPAAGMYTVRFGDVLLGSSDATVIAVATTGCSLSIDQSNPTPMPQGQRVYLPLVVRAR
ncbi:MAG: hypothetical protein HC911_17570 [Chloroflexaceae bacterium]|nr:hypothetical protein [Chloroflexaceae bacterium]